MHDAAGCSSRAEHRESDTMTIRPIHAPRFTLLAAAFAAAGLPSAAPSLPQEHATPATALAIPKAVRLAELLAMHAQQEEQVLYPAAILVGELIRARRHTH
jgi:hypothetical protein